MSLLQSLNKVKSRVETTKDRIRVSRNKKTVEKLQKLRVKRLREEGTKRLNKAVLKEEKKIKEAKKFNKSFKTRKFRKGKKSLKQVGRKIARLGKGRSYVDRSVLSGNMRR